MPAISSLARRPHQARDKEINAHIEEWFGMFDYNQVALHLQLCKSPSELNCPLASSQSHPDRVVRFAGR